MAMATASAGLPPINRSRSAVPMNSNRSVPSQSLAALRLRVGPRTRMLTPPPTVRLVRSVSYGAFRFSSHPHRSHHPCRSSRHSTVHTRHGSSRHSTSSQSILMSSAKTITLCCFATRSSSSSSQADDDQEDEEDLYEDVLDDAEYDVRAIKEVAKRTVAACREGEAAAIELAFEFAENQARLEDEEDDFEGGIYLFCCTALLRHAVVNECFYVPPPFLEVLADLIDELRNMGWELREDAVPEEELTDEATISQYMDSYEEEQRLRQLQMEKERAERAETPDGDRLVEGSVAIPGVRITKLAKPGATAMAGDDDDAPSHSSSPSPPPPSSSESKPKPKPKPKRDSPPSSPRTDSKKPARQSVSEILNAGREPKRGGGRRRRR